MNKILVRTRKIIFQRQKDILSSVVILSSMMILSRFLGLIRNRTYATFFTTEELDLLLAAHRLPDFVFEILITGALSSAFIPLFIKYKKDKKILSRNISTVINLISLMLLVFMVVVFVGADVIIPIITPGFSEAQIQEVIRISRILIACQLPFFIYGNILSGISQANRIFMLTAIAPLIYTIGVIAGTVALSDTLWLYGPVIGMVVGAFLFFLVQIPIMHFTAFRFTFFAFDKKVIREFFTLFIPRTLSVLTAQIEQTIDLSLATLVGSGSVTVVYFAQRLQLFPVAFVGMAFGQASLPYLASLYKEKRITAIRKLFVDSALQLLFLSVPLSFFFIFARTPLVRIAYGGKMFDWEATVLTARALSYFAISIPFHSVFYFVTRAFYAGHDTKTPFYINLFSISLNIILSVLFIVVMELPVWSLGLSFSISIMLNVTIQFAAYYKKINGYNVTKLLVNGLKIYLASFLASLPAYFFLKIFDQLIIDTTRTINVFILLVTSFIIMGVTYVFFTWLFRIEEIYVMIKLITKITHPKKPLDETITEST